MSTNKTVLITGTSSGIGLATALGAARAGWRTVATMRDLGRATALREAAEAAGIADRIDICRIDVTEPSTVTACLTEVINRHGTVDAVINNAGSGHVGTLEQDGIDAVRAVFEVNFFGVLTVAQQALPYLRLSKGRLMTITSVGGVVGQPFNEAYCAAKFAVEGYLESLAPLAALVGVTVCVVEPGAVASDFVTNARIDPPALPDPAYLAAQQAYMARTAAVFSGQAQLPSEAADAIVDVLNAPAPLFRTQTSAAAHRLVAMKLSDVDGRRIQDMTSSWLNSEDPEQRTH